MSDLKWVPPILPFDIGGYVVPADKIEGFMKIASKTQDFFSGYERKYFVKGKEYLIHDSYDDELDAIGLLPKP